MAITPEKWAEHLPEIGEPLFERIEQIKTLEDYLRRERMLLWASILQCWTADQIGEAKAIARDQERARRHWEESDREQNRQRLAKPERYNTIRGRP